MEWLEAELGQVLARSPVIDSAAVGPSQRRYANAAVVLETQFEPGQLLRRLHAIEHRFGRVRRGQRWRSRTLDLDIVLWDGGTVTEPGLEIPHPRFRTRDFVLGPAAAIAPNWRDPKTGLTLAQLYARLTGNRPLPR